MKKRRNMHINVYPSEIYFQNNCERCTKHTTCKYESHVEDIMHMLKLRGLKALTTAPKDIPFTFIDDKEMEPTDLDMSCSDYKEKANYQK